MRDVSVLIALGEFGFSNPAPNHYTDTVTALDGITVISGAVKPSFFSGITSLTSVRGTTFDAKGILNAML